MNPSIGRIVVYRLDKWEADAVNKRRGAAIVSGIAKRQEGCMAHVGNVVREGDQFPAVVVRVWSGSGINAQVLLDGTDTLWTCSRVEGNSAGNWSWPERV
jgi:hypothetical protein